jgi:3-deoxy-D-manno-octulosonate 8-phosphate phosphatase (KDO 8-P phosphatase)
MEKILKDIKLIVLDIDGVLTDNKFHMDELGNLRKTFNYSDLIAIDQMKKYFDVILLSSADRVNPKFAEYVDLPYHHIAYGGRRDKKDFMFRYLQKRNLNWRNVLFVGDSPVDKKLLHVAALAFCPADAAPEIRRQKNIYQLKNKGGEGVIEELYEIIKPEIMRRLKHG